MLKFIYRFVRSSFFLAVFLLSVLVTMPLSYLFLSIVRQSSFRRNYCILRSHIYFWLLVAGIRVEAIGLDNLLGLDGAVLVSNHQSMIDPWIVISWLPKPIYTLIAEEIVRIPVLPLQYMFRKSGAVSISGALKGNSQISIGKIAELVKKGESLLVFAEGITTIDGSLLRFKWGAVEIASLSGKPIVPVALKGTYECFPPLHKLFVEVLAGSHLGKSKIGMLWAFSKVLFSVPFRFNQGTCRVKFGKPISIPGQKEADLDFLRETSEQLRNQVMELMNSF